MLIGVGALVLAAVVGLMLVRGVDPVEVWAAVLFMPVFVAFMVSGLTGGLIAGVVAAGIYIVLRAPAIDAVGFDRFAGLILSRSAAYMLFGAIGGFANSVLAQSLQKLELYDEIDDDTGLRNARAFLTDTDLEMARARRYKTFFSVVALEFPSAGLNALGRRKRAAVLRDLGASLREAVRTVDLAVHAQDGDTHHVAVILPETASEGAAVFGGRLAPDVSAFLNERGADVGLIAPNIMSFPDDEAALQSLRERFGQIEATEHPTTAVEA